MLAFLSKVMLPLDNEGLYKRNVKVYTRAVHQMHTMACIAGYRA